jgi:hypothetical protein
MSATSQVLPQQGVVATADPAAAGAAAAPAASPLTMRYSLLDVNTIAALMYQAQQTMQSNAAAQLQASATQGLTAEQAAAAGAPTADSVQGAVQAAQQQATSAWTDTSAADQDASAAERAAVAKQQQAAAAQQQATTQQASQQSATQKAGWNYWNVHMAQYRGAYNNDGPSMAPNCGPTSVTMALRLAGLDVPGANGSKSNNVITQARVIATGKNDVSVGTTDSELERVVNAAGGKWTESTNLGQLLGWVKQGVPVVLAGNPINAWDHRYSQSQVYNFDGGHWVTISGYDSKTGYYVVNDPLSQIGPIYVSEQELSNYFNDTTGRLGIAVYK